MSILVIKNSESFLTGLDYILKQFLSGVKSKEVEYEVANLKMYDIKACRACTQDLTFDEFGRCECDDDMQHLYPKLREYSHWVIATPFTGKIPGKLINFLDRLSPLFLADEKHLAPEFSGNLALITTTAHYEYDVFKTLEEHFEDFSPVVSKKFTGNIARPHSSAIDYYNTDTDLLEEIKNTAFKLGQDFAASGTFQKQDLENIRKPLITKSDYENINEKLYQN
jgi:multimeric flavodoxin WrbA